MSQFVGEEKTRLLLGQDLETVAMVKEMASNFDNLSKEEKFKAGIKLYLSLVTPPLTLAKTANTIPKTAKPLLPAAPLRINPPRAAKNSLGGFTPDPGISKSFTPQYAMVNPTNMPQWQQLARSAEALADVPFAPGSVGAGKVWSIKGRLKAAQLPIDGKLRFVPPKGYIPSQNLPSVKIDGYKCYEDRFKNKWKPGPSRTSGQDFEWDVQLSESGKQQFKWLIGNKNHLNISLDGRITHK